MQVYTYKGKSYIVLGEGRFKHPIHRNWIDAVLYVPVTKKFEQGIPHMRDAKEFYSKYTPVDLEDHSNPLRAGRNLNTKGI